MQMILGGIYTGLARKYMETRCMEYGLFDFILLATIVSSGKIEIFFDIDTVTDTAAARADFERAGIRCRNLDTARATDCQVIERNR
jgi:hypothetical protein